MPRRLSRAPRAVLKERLCRLELEAPRCAVIRAWAGLCVPALFLLSSPFLLPGCRVQGRGSEASM